MCAVIGIYRLDGRPVCRGELARMGSILAYRGPDGAGLWSEKSTGLGQRQLWTTPQSYRERLPMVNTSGNLVLTADARIDNRNDLIASLRLTDRPTEAIPDGALILAAYEKWGERCTEKLLGDFAFAIWDQTRQILFAARDQFGVRPFYYYYLPDRLFAFASNIKALFGLPDVPRKLNENKVADYLGGIFEDKASTFYQDILRLPPAHSLTVSAQGLRLNRYWALDPSSEFRLGSDEEYADGYREIFTEAVRCRLRSAFPVGSHLSGGLDSSSITCVARDLITSEKNHGLMTFSIIFDEVRESDERPFINAVVDQGGVEPHYIHGDRFTPLTEICRIISLQDGPFYGPNLFLNWQVWKVAQQCGVRVLLDGIMGDNVVSHGFPYLNELAHSWRWGSLTREVRALSKRRNVHPWKIIGRFLWNDGIMAHFPVGLRGVLGYVIGRSSAGNLSPIINLDFARMTGLLEQIRMQNETKKERAWSAKESHYQELSSGMIPAALEVAANGESAFGLELRFPFLDRRLVEFCYAIPAEQKIKDGWTRAIVRRALADHLPSKIRLRTDKGDLGPNFIRGLRSEKEQLRALLYDHPEPLAQYINLIALKALFQKFVDGAPLSDDDLIMIYQTALLAFWLRQWVLTTEAPCNISYGRCTRGS